MNEGYISSPIVLVLSNYLLSDIFSIIVDIILKFSVFFIEGRDYKNVIANKETKKTWRVIALLGPWTSAIAYSDINHDQDVLM